MNRLKLENRLKKDNQTLPELLSILYSEIDEEEKEVVDRSIELIRKCFRQIDEDYGMDYKKSKLRVMFSFKIMGRK